MRVWPRPIKIMLIDRLRALVDRKATLNRQLIYCQSELRAGQQFDGRFSLNFSKFLSIAAAAGRLSRQIGKIKSAGR